MRKWFEETIFSLQCDPAVKNNLLDGLRRESCMKSYLAEYLSKDMADLEAKSKAEAIGEARGETIGTVNTLKKSIMRLLERNLTTVSAYIQARLEKIQDLAFDISEQNFENFAKEEEPQVANPTQDPLSLQKPTQGGLGKKNKAKKPSLAQS
jgi:hypothetical protein